MVVTQNGVRGLSVPQPVGVVATLGVALVLIPLQALVARTVPSWDPKRKLVNVTTRAVQVHLI